MPKNSKKEPDVSETDANLETIATELRLKHIARNSFIDLCNMGCDPKLLGHLFATLSHDKCYFNPLDSLETALGEIEKRDIESLPDQLIKLAERLQRLNNTNLVRRMGGTGEFGGTLRLDEEPGRGIEQIRVREQIFGLPGSLLYYANIVVPLILKSNIGTKEKPGYSHRLKSIYDHVHECTSKWNDALIAHILNGLDPKNTATEDTLRQWRNRQGIINKESTRKNKPK